jgi:MFS transporter, DHA2 family, multidrug resistance protein
MGNATSLFNLVRNLGGSIGISVVNTIQERLVQRNINTLGTNVNELSAQAQAMFEHLKQMFMSRSGDPAAAAQQARAAMFGAVARQAGMIAYNDVFWILCGLFLFMLPFLFLMKRPAHLRGPAGMH